MKGGVANERERLDSLVVERGLAETRARSQAIILGGGVSVNGQVITKPGTSVSRDARVELTAPPLPYVSRGALKLKHALDHFGVDVRTVTAVDVGSSTGGFTDVLLQEGAALVYAIDVGYGQLAWKLRTDPRVVVMERTNIRAVQSLPTTPSLAVVDVSFISLRLVLPVLRRLLAPTGAAIVLIKPQFEAGRGVAKKGVITDQRVRLETVRGILRFAQDTGWSLAGLVRSPITGPAGNVEYLAYLSLDPALDSRSPNELADRVE